MKLKGQIRLSQYFSFRYHIYLQLFALFSIVVFILFGYWQLNRAELKEKMQSQYLFSLTDRSTPISLNQMIANNQGEEIENLTNYTKVEVTGSYHFDKQILRDNRIYQNQLGFYLFTPFVIDESNDVILVNRGWIAVGENREDYPKKIQPNDQASQWDKKITIEGLVFNSLDRLELGKQPLGKWPVIVQNLDYKAIGHYFDGKVIQTTVRLMDHQENGYVRDWQFQTSTTKEKHQAYALQWFSFALIAFAVLVYKSFVFKPKQQKK